MNQYNWTKILPCAEALQAALEYERLLEWKGAGRVADHAKITADRATLDFLDKRIKYHQENIGHKNKNNRLNA